MMRKIDSEIMSAIGFNIEMQILRVEFLSGKIYDYYPCPLAVFREFWKAESKDIFFMRYIKNNPQIRPLIPIHEDGENPREQRAESVFMTAKNPTSKSLKFDENKGRLEQARERIRNHFSSVRNSIMSETVLNSKP